MLQRTLLPVLACLVPTTQAQLGDLHRMLPEDVERTAAIAVGDVDGDGAPDLVLGNQGLGALGRNRLFLNDGAGRFLDASNASLPDVRNDTRAVLLTDVDGDGDLDLVTGNHVDDDELYLNDGAGVFIDVSSTHMPNSSKRTRSISSGDVDGDGDPDLLIGNMVEQIVLLLNDGTGVFSTATGTGLPFGSAEVSQLVDVDADGDLDAILRSTLYRNNGLGFFTVDALAIPGSGSNTAISVGDVDGDGDLDIVSNDFPLGGLYLNDGAGVFSDASATLPAPLPVVALMLVDVDGDGDRDILGALFGPATESTLLFTNDGAGLFTDSSDQCPQIDESTLSLGTGDFDNDGDQDFLLGTNSQDQLAFNDGAGVFEFVTSEGWPQQYDWTLRVALGDIDGDGDLDALLGRYASNDLFLNDGAGQFVEALENLPALTNMKAVELGDLDGDGDPDLLVTNDTENRLFLNDGALAFTDVTNPNFPPSPVPGDGFVNLGIADVDGNGAPDVYAFSQNQNRLYLNSGPASFADVTATHLPALSGGTSIAFADIDLDGDLDAVGGQFAENILLLNDGTGAFSDGTAGRLPTNTQATYDVALADLDGNGSPDLYTANLGQDRLFHNDGVGVLADVTATHLPPNPNPTRQVDLVDMDDDGDTDVVLVSIQPLLLNNGLGSFNSTPYPGGLHGAWRQAIGDVDGDEDPDVLLGRIDVDGLLHNLTRHVAWRRTPSVGKTLEMDVRGDPGGLWVLLRSLGVANVPIVLPLYGTLFLDPGSNFVAAAGGVLDANGQALVSFQVPPSLPIGTTGYWQGLVGTPLRFTNMDPTPLSGL